jgi:hypothetical protein
MTTANSFGNPPFRTFPMHPRVELASAAALPTEFGNFRIHVFTSDKDDREQVAIVHGDVFGVESVATRIPYGPESGSGRISPKRREFSFDGGAARIGGTVRSSAPLQFMIFLVASWLARQQGEAIEYLRAENRVLRGRLGRKRLRFTDAERRLLAEKGRALGRKRLAEVASLATDRARFASLVDAIMAGLVSSAQATTVAA